MLYSYCFSLTKTVFNTAAVTLTHFSYVLSQRTHDFSQVWFFIMNKKWLNGSVELSPCLCCNVSAVLWVCVSVTGTENKIKYHIHSQTLITTSPKSNERVDFVTPFFYKESTFPEQHLSATNIFVFPPSRSYFTLYAYFINLGPLKLLLAFWTAYSKFPGDTIICLNISWYRIFYNINILTVFVSVFSQSNN